ncbi:MAG: hypothetical protein KDB90_07785 [Planctomycetes bacterium]|nr:hypothetical protein [Planctomycetota bacterium]
MTDTDEKQKEKDEALQRRKEELEDELERYAQAGAFSPNLIKITRWVSRGLYLAMAAGFMIMLFSGWGKVSSTKYEEAVQRAIDIKKTADDTKTQLQESESNRMIAEAKAKLLENELARLRESKEGKDAADAAQIRAAAVLEALGSDMEPAKLEQAYRGAAEEGRLDLLCLFSASAKTDEGGLMKMVATSERSLAEKIIAVRWMGERKDEGSRNLLKTLGEGDGLLADEAKAALKQLGE